MLSLPKHLYHAAYFVWLPSFLASRLKRTGAGGEVPASEMLRQAQHDVLKN